MNQDSPLEMARVWRLVWLVLGLPAALIMSLGVAVWMVPSPKRPIRDLTQDWLSARCFFDGLSVYTAHTVSSPRYLGIPDVPDLGRVTVNAHPPASVLFFLPLGLLRHDVAVVTWNLASLVMLAGAVWAALGSRGLNCDGWHLLAAGCLVVCSAPLMAQVKYAQINPLLTLLIATAWVNQRQARPLLAGGLIGLAAGIKLFPGFLLLYFVCQRQWKALAAGGAVLAAMNVAAIAVFGLDEFLHYFQAVIPEVNLWRSNWANCSLTGFWSRLFDVADGATREWFHAPLLAKLLTYATSGLVTAAIAWKAWSARTSQQRDVAFAAAVVGMLLVSPITWDHYRLMLLVPLAILWYYAPAGWWQGLLWAVAVPLCWLPAYQLWRLTFERSTETFTRFAVASPVQNLVVLGLPTYALIALLVLALVWPAAGQDHAVR